MRILFWGTPEFAVPSFRALVGEGHEVAAVVTRPDRPAGRGRKLRASPVREVAMEEGVPVLTPGVPRGEEFVATLRELGPEISVVVAYGHILRPEILEVPPKGSINVHASLLPELRGPAPINWAIARGHERTGITVIRMTEGMDEGPIILQQEVPISSDDTTSALQLRLAEVGAEALVEALGLLQAGLADPREQDHSMATYAPKVNRDTARIDWARPAREVAAHIRGMDAVPGAWTLLGDRPLKVFQPDPSDEAPTELQSGTVLRADPSEGLRVATGEGGSVSLGEVQPPGKRRMPAADWLRGHHGIQGERLE